MNLALLAERDLSERGPRPRLWFEERSYTHRELHDASLRLAGVLAALGVARDDRVMLVLPNCPEVLIAYPAIWRVGAVAVPALPLLEQRELEYVAKDCAPKLVIAALDQLPKLRRVAALMLVVTEGRAEPPAPALSFERALAHAEAYGSALRRGDRDLAVLLYTSGTTGKPKGVMLSHRNLSANAENTYDSAQRKQREDVSMLALPLAHAFGLGASVSSYLFGGRSILMRRFSPDLALRLIERHRATVMAGVPTMYLAMLRVQEPYDTRSMQRWLVAAAPMPPAQLAVFEARFGGVMHAGYGLSEASPAVAAEREGEARKPGSTGRALEGVRVRIVDDEGKPLPPGEVGEICVAGENVSLGYFDQPEATAETFRAGWLHTGDVGYLDADGYLFVVERKKDLILRGGFHVYPQDVEAVLLRHPGVLECGVVGVPDALLGEQVCACVVRRPGSAIDAEALIAHCESALAKYKTPRYVEFLDALPRTPLGKIRKRALRAWALQKLAGQG